MIHGPLLRYVKLRAAHAMRMPGTFSPPPRVSDPDLHHGTWVTHVTRCILRSLTSGFLWSRCRGERSRHFRRMRNPQFYIYGKRPIERSPAMTNHWSHDVLSIRLLRTNIKCTVDQYTIIFFQHTEFENVCKRLSIMSQLQTHRTAPSL